VSTDARRRSAEEVGAKGVLGAGRVNVKVWTVDAGCRVDAMTSTSRVNESWKHKDLEWILNRSNVP
jgi:hypothetical protein